MKNILLMASFLLSSLFCAGHVEGNVCAGGVCHMINGGYEVYTIISGDKAYQPASLYYGENDCDKAKVDELVPGGEVPTSMNCFVVKTPEGYIMFDAGLPESKGGKTLERLGSVNITPDEIYAIYLTHSHFDHIGGLLDEAGNATFSNATVYIPGPEYSYMKESMAEATRKIEQAYMNHVVIFNPGEILPYNVLPIATFGHTPGHTAYRIGSLLFVGDLLHGSSIQLIDPTICAGYDADRAQSIASRRLLLSYIVENSLTAFGAHLPNPGIIAK